MHGLRKVNEGLRVVTMTRHVFECDVVVPVAVKVCPSHKEVAKWLTSLHCAIVEIIDPGKTVSKVHCKWEQW